LSVEQKLREILVPWLKNTAMTLDITSKLEDLNIDSLDLVEVMFEIEEKFDVSLAQTHQEAKTASLADVVGWIEHQLALKRDGAPALMPALQGAPSAR
jgi:acyl carrier protein